MARSRRAQRSAPSVRQRYLGGRHLLIWAWVVAILSVGAIAVHHHGRTGVGDCYEDVPPELTAAGRQAIPSDAVVAQASPAAQVAGQQPADADADQAGDATGLHALEPVDDRPVTLSLGRAYGVAYAQARFTVKPFSPSSEGSGREPADAATSEARTAPDDTADGSGQPGIDGLPDRDGRVYLASSIGQFSRDDGALLANGVPVSLPGDAGVSRGAVDEPGTAGDAAPATIPPLNAMAWSRHGVVTVELCVDRSDRDAIGDPGMYVGSVAVVDQLFARTEVPFVVTMAHANPWALFALMLGVVAVAALYVWLLRAHEPSDDAIDLTEFVEWAGTRTGVLAICTGAVAAYVAYTATYLADSTWGASIAQMGALVGAGFTAFITAAATVISASASPSGPKMPDLTTQPLADARRQLEQLGFSVVVHAEHGAGDPGTVLRTEPAPNRRTRRSAPVELYVAHGEQEGADAPARARRRD